MTFVALAYLFVHCLKSTYTELFAVRKRLLSLVCVVLYMLLLLTDIRFSAIPTPQSLLQALAKMPLSLGSLP